MGWVCWILERCEHCDRGWRISGYGVLGGGLGVIFVGGLMLIF